MHTQLIRGCGGVLRIGGGGGDGGSERWLQIPARLVITGVWTQRTSYAKRSRRQITCWLLFLPCCPLSLTGPLWVSLVHKPVAYSEASTRSAEETSQSNSACVVFFPPPCAFKYIRQIHKGTSLTSSSLTCETQLSHCPNANLRKELICYWGNPFSYTCYAKRYDSARPVVPNSLLSSVPLVYIWFRLDQSAFQFIHLYWTSHFPNMTTQRAQPIPPTHYRVNLSLSRCKFCLVNKSGLQFWHRYLVWSKGS